ncbi:hypothetical protein [Paractinoplanes deccanensis]
MTEHRTQHPSAPCPAWCRDHLGDAGEVLHCHDYPETWGADRSELGERLRLSLQRQDDADGQGDVRVCVQYLPTGHVALGTVELSIPESTDLALAIIRLAAESAGLTPSDALASLLRGEKFGQHH